MLSIMGQLDGL